MKYTLEESLKMIDSRKRTIIRKRRKIMKSVLSGVSLFLFGMVTVLTTIGTRGTFNEETARETGNFATVLAPGAGGYVFIAVVGFLVGVVAAILWLRLVKQKKDN